MAKRKTIKVAGTIDGIVFQEGDLTIEYNQTISHYSAALAVRNLHGSLERQFESNLHCLAELVSEDGLPLSCQVITYSLPITLSPTEDISKSPWADFVVNGAINGLDAKALFADA